MEGRKERKLKIKKMKQGRKEGTGREGKGRSHEKSADKQTHISLTSFTTSLSMRGKVI